MAFNYRLWWQKVKTFLEKWTPTWIKNTFWPDEQRLKELRNNKRGLEPITYAAMHGSSEDINLLKKHGHNVNCHFNYIQETPLHYVIRLGSIESVKNLLTVGAGIEELDINGNTPLHTATSHGNTQAIKILLEEKPAIGAINKEGNTPLHLAAQDNNIEAIKILIEKGADVTKINKEKKCPIHLTTNTEIKDLLNQVKEKLQMISEDKKWQNEIESQRSNPKRNNGISPTNNK